MSEKTLKQHLSEVMAKAGYVQYDGKAPATAGGFSFASAEAVFGKVRKELAARGICISGDSALEHYSVDGKMSQAVIKSTITFHLGDEELSVSAHGEGKTTGGKAVMVANTAANKYAVAKLLLMSWGDDAEFLEDDDAITPAASEWMVKAQAAANKAKGDTKKFSGWWATFGDSVKEECGKEQAALVYDAYTILLREMGGGA